jgi:hypothetical protein
MIQRGQWKLVCQPIETGYLLRLHDLANDPECQHDVYAMHAEQVIDLQKKLMQMLRESIKKGP